MIDAVLFDLYETLISEVRADRRPEPSPGSRLGIPEDIFRSQFRARTEQRMTGVYRSYTEVLIDICKVVGSPIDIDLIERIEKDRIAFHRTLSMTVESNIFQLVGTVKNKGLKTGLITNVSCEEIIGFKESLLHDLFDCTVHSCEVGYAKPSPEIYLIACDRLCVTPECCIYVGDGASNELVGAARVGMRPYQATWFMERWPDDWRLQHETSWNTNYPKLRETSELIALIDSNNRMRNEQQGV